MGSALAQSWAGKHRLMVLDPNTDLPLGGERVEPADVAGLGADCVVVLAVKPQIFPLLSPVLAPLGEKGALFLSIMAGATIAGMSAALGDSRRIVRAMPNTPAAIGRGITAAVPAEAVSADDRKIVASLLEATGAFVWLDDEADLDAVTAVSGSGPAYFFRMTEALAKAGEQAGLSPELAMQLARATFTGAAALAESTDQPLSTLREQVTSPGGTTAAGLAQMNLSDAVDGLMDNVVAAATARSRELSS